MSGERYLLDTNAIVLCLLPGGAAILLVVGLAHGNSPLTRRMAAAAGVWPLFFFLFAYCFIDPSAREPLDSLKDRGILKSDEFKAQESSCLA